jgi:uncharacterized protein YbaP (TraB family)
METALHLPATLLRRCFATLLSLFGVAALAAATPAAAEPAMWVVRDADSTVYLLGTFHALKPDTPWKTDKIEQALQSSDELWLEADVIGSRDLMQTYALTFGFDYTHPLSTKLGKEDFAQLRQIAASMKIPEERLEQMKPWLLCLLLIQGTVHSDGRQAEQGADLTLMREAEAAGKAVRAFETPEQHMGIFAKLPEKLAIQVLHSTLHGPEDDGKGAASKLDAMEAVWLAGDADKIDAGFSDMKKQAPAFYDALILQRNANWVKQIASLMKGSGTSFVAVGAGHLVGPKGLPAQLKGLGYTVSRY